MAPDPRDKPEAPPDDPASPAGAPQADGSLDLFAQAVDLLREGACDADEAAWLTAASRRIRARFRERLYGPYADLDAPEGDDEETGIRPSRPG